MADEKKLATCSFVHEMDLTKGIITFEEMRKTARELTGFAGDDKHIVGVEDYGLTNGYRTIIREIAAEGIKPTLIFCPVGEGELITELASEAETVWGKDAPRIVGVTVPENVLVRKDETFLRKVGKSVADKLTNGYSKFKALVENFIKTGRIELKTASEGKIASEYKYLSTIGVSAEPSAAAAFCGAMDYASLTPQDTVVIINTGKGIYDQNAVEKVWARRARRWLKNIGLVAAGIIAAVGIKFGYDRVQAYRQEHQEMEIYIQVSRELDDRMAVTNTASGKCSYPEREEFLRSCMLLPDMDAEKCGQAKDYYGLTERQRQFLRMYGLFTSEGLHWSRCIPLLIRNYKEGKGLDGYSLDCPH